MSYTVGTGCSGIGAPDLAARLLGMRTVWQIEKDAFCQKVLRKNFPEVETLYGDIFNAHPCYVDIFVAGFPCQPFSNAGNQLGERDARYLVPEMLRVINDVRPRVVVVENVPGFTSLDDGKSFKSLLGALAEMGLDAEWGHIRGSDVGAPHQRERWWLVAYAQSAGDRRDGSRLGSERLAARSPDVRRESERGCEALADPLSDRHRTGTPARNRSLSVESGHAARQALRQWQFEPRPGSYGRVLGNTHRAGRGEHRWRKPIQGPQPASEHPNRRSGRETQPRLGRVIDGFSFGVDGFSPYPAGLAERQYDFEPPRVTTRTDGRSNRVKALGNSMALDVVFEVLLAVRTWLTAQDEAQGIEASS